MSSRRRLLGNIGWLVADRLFRMGLGLVVGVWVARYLGPGEFGLLNYAMALVSLFTTIAALGLGDIVIRDLIRLPDRAGAILGTALGLQLAGGLAALLLAVATVMLLRPGETGVWSVTALCALVLLGQCGDTIRCWFEAKVQSRNVVWVANGVFAVATLARIAGVLLHKPLTWFAMVYGLEAVLTSAALVVMMWRHERDGPAALVRWRFEPAQARAMLAVSWPLALSGVAVVLNMKIDQVMLGQMLDDGAVGLFSAAVRISEVWYFIPVAIAASAYPFIARATDPQLMALRWSQLYAAMLWIAVGAAGFATLFSGWIVDLLYGPAYAAAAPVLVVHIWSGVNVALGLVWSRWIILENRPRLALLVQTVGAALNIGFNLVLIPRYGIMGAAVATLGSYWLSGTLSYLVHRPAVTLGYIGRALTPWRLVGRFAA